MANVDMLLRSLTAKQFLEWEAFARLEPFGELRSDYRIASIVTMLANVNRDSKQKKEPWTLEDFVVKFGEQEPKKKQTWQEQVAILNLIAKAYSK